MSSTNKIIVFDLDDTLFKEIEYLKAAYRLISQKFWPSQWDVHYSQMLNEYYSGENVFKNICSQRLDVEFDELLDLYRYGVHELSLEEDVRNTLSDLKAQGVIIGIVSDGRFETQMNKVNALRLKEFVEDELIVINSDEQSVKPSTYGFNKLMKAVSSKISGSGLDFTYIADNPVKDFIAPNKLGWGSICLLDNGENIHKQDLESCSDEARPKKVITSLPELLNFL